MDAVHCTQFTIFFAPHLNFLSLSLSNSFFYSLFTLLSFPFYLLYFFTRKSRNPATYATHQVKLSFGSNTADANRCIASRRCDGTRSKANENKAWLMC